MNVLPLRMPTQHLHIEKMFVASQSVKDMDTNPYSSKPPRISGLGEERSCTKHVHMRIARSSFSSRSATALGPRARLWVNSAVWAIRRAFSGLFSGLFSDWGAFKVAPCFESFQTPFSTPQWTDRNNGVLATYSKFQHPS